MDASDSTETLGDRLNNEPVIFRGSTSTELLIIVLCATAFWIPFGFVIAVLLGAWSMTLGIAAVGIIVSVFFGSTFFQHIKRGRPDDYYQQLVFIKLHKLNIRKSELILKQGPWSLGRDNNAL